MEECEESEMTELTEFQCEASDATSQDDEDEVEELQNSLREVVQDQSVKPKLQCLMVDPSFSMVTVQSEDSGIVWETASSRCSTPWASETSSISEACSMEGSGAAGKITIIFDEDKVIRRRTRSGGRSSRLRDRLSRSSGSRSASALGVERPEMAEVSIPNVKEQKKEQDLEDIKNKDQQLFSLISEGYEILNIRVPSKLPTVDEEESTELQDNLSYLDQTPKIRSRNHLNETTVRPQEVKTPECNEPSESSIESELRHTPTPKDGSNDIDYFEKFTLVDEVVPGQKSPDLHEDVEEHVMEAETMPAKTVKESPSESDESFVLVTDAEIVGEHLDEVFYGEGAPADAMQQGADEEVNDREKTRARRESQRLMKESGSVLFGTEETTLTPIYISPGPPKIIDPILLEEPTAMSFMYSDLYEDYIGERIKSDEEYSEVESVTSEKSFKKCLSDSEEAEGYLEKFILKDDTPTVDVPADSMEDKREGRMMWPQSKFEMTGCLTRAEEEDEEKRDDTKQDVDTEADTGARTTEELVPEMAKEGVQHSKESKEQAVLIESIHEDRQTKEEMQSPQKRTEKTLPASQPFDVQVETEEHQRDDQGSDQSMIKTKELPPKQVQEQGSKVPSTLTKVPQQDTAEDVCEKAAAELKMTAAVEKEAQEKTPAEFGMIGKERLTSTEPSVETTCNAKELNSQQAAPIEVFTGSEPMVHAVMKVTENTVDEEVTQTKVQIDLQEEITERESTAEVLSQDVIEVDVEVKEQETDSAQDTLECEHQTTEGDEAAIPKTNNDLIVFVPKGEAVEMDIKMSTCSERVTESNTLTLSDLDLEYEHLTAPDNGTREKIAESQLEEEPVGQMEASSPSPSEEMAEIEEFRTEEDKDEGIFSPLRSFAPQEDLSGLHEDVKPDVADVDEKVEDAPERYAVKAYTGLEIGPFRGDIQQKTSQDESPEEGETGEEYEMITEQDTKETAEPHVLGDAQEQAQAESDQVVEKDKRVSDVFVNEDLIEADYDIIDAEEQHQAQLAAELQGMDWFCLTCQCLLSKDECESEDHGGHEVTAVDKAYEEIRERLSDWISELQGRSENIEDLVCELELAYNSVEDQCVESEAAMQAQNDEMMALVMQQYNNMSVNMEEEKKSKLEQLYDQIISFQESIDSAKATLETTAREAETDARPPEDIHTRLKEALESTMSLDLCSKGLLVFQDYAKGNNSQLTQRKGIPVPQRPTLEPQEPGSATSTSVTVYWCVNPGDIIDCFQVYCMEEPQGAVSEEYRVTVKESYCVLEELEPDKSYKVWVMAVNYTGCSLPSERVVFTTAPSVPVIDSERCAVMWDSAKLRWSPAKQSAGLSYTLEYCRQYEMEGDGLRSISGIKSCKHEVMLQPDENYLFYIKAVNEAGASEQSEAALISTKGTRFRLLKASAHPALELSEDHTSVCLSQDAHKHRPATDKQPPSILGELLPARGRHYWETTVSGCAAYRLGVAYSPVHRKFSLGENNQSWCLQCIPSPSGCRYEMLHNDTQSSVFVMESPERVGTLLDYQQGHLCFYNAQTGQLFGSFRHDFTQPCHPGLALETAGRLEVRMVLEVPEFAKDC
ncbi:cardiomyopathy-associated protein 5 [Dunckerocampus dactyliophorus]|uniref:cardiomyopathy-associated protein 5 n=1 Tax=Dunckerocampus dactyliophorus TaxID=161453 RepID=UPI0024075469|nr:cardiomyopathy-associated protein 5 [Dunckerocampus dactyliophorus]